MSVPKTIDEIARATGFSVTTVRLVMNGQAERYRISQATRKLIQDYVAEHGFVLNHAARALKLRRSDTIGFLAPELSNPFFARLMAALEALCRQQGLVLLTASTQDDPRRERRALQSLLARGVDGLVVAPCSAADFRSFVGRRQAAAIVGVDRIYGGNRYASVSSDNFGGAVTLTKAMLAENRGPVPFLCANPSLPTIVDRIRGFEQACEESGIPEQARQLLRTDHDTLEAAAGLAAQLMQEGAPIPSALMCTSLLMLEGVLQHLRTRLGHIPPEILIGTFDDHPMLDFLPNPVISVRQDETALAARAFSLLMRQISGGAPSFETVTIPCELVRRPAARFFSPVAG